MLSYLLKTTYSASPTLLIATHKDFAQILFLLFIHLFKNILTIPYMPIHL